MSTDTQGKFEYFFAITGQADGGQTDIEGNFIMSELGKATVYICGKEKIVPTMLGIKRPIDLLQTTDPEAERIIALDMYK